MWSIMLILFLFLTEINCLPTKEKINELPPILSVQPRHVHLAIGDKEDTFSVSWSTINNTDESTVIVYNEEEELRFTGLSTLFVDGGPKKASQWIHKVTVYGLESKRSYRYVVGSSDGWSDMLIMQTLPSGIEKIHRKYNACRLERNALLWISSRYHFI